MANRRKAAFTIVELLIVIAIIAILTAVASVSYSGVKARSRDAQRKNDFSQLKIYLSNYYSAQIPSRYVISTTKATLDNSSDPLATALKPNYIREIPLDPRNSGNYVYKYQSFTLNGFADRDYTLFATLENTNDPKGNNGASEGFQVKPD